MLRFLDLIDHRHGIILNRDSALSLRILQQLIRAKPELAGSLAGKQVGRWRQEGPFKARFLPEHVERFARRQRALFVFGRETREDPLTGRPA